jgi:DNA-directed RNA polymerase specialized sigma24 family protein
MIDAMDTQDLDDFTVLFVGHYAQLVRLAALLLGDAAAAEDVVQEAFIRVHRVLARRHAPHPMPDVASAEEDACTSLARREVVVALRALPARQREAVVLRYWADLTEAQAGELMGVSTGSVKAYTSRGLAKLGELLGESR